MRERRMGRRRQRRPISNMRGERQGLAGWPPCRLAPSPGSGGLTQSLPRTRTRHPVGLQSAALLELLHRGIGRHAKVSVGGDREPLCGQHRLQRGYLIAIVAKPQDRPSSRGDRAGASGGKRRLCPLETAAAVGKTVEAAIDPPCYRLEVVL